MSVRDMLNEWCKVKRPTTAIDEYGAVSATTSIVASAVPCRVQPLTLAEQARYDAEVMEVDHRVFLESGNDIRRRDWLVLSSTSPLSSISLEVQATTDRGEFMVVEALQRKV